MALDAPATSNGAARAEPVTGVGFRVEIDDAIVGYFSEFSGLGFEYEMLTYQEGGQNDYGHMLRGHRKYQNLKLKRGVTNEPALLKWAFDVREWQDRGNLTVTLVGPDGKDVRSWSFVGAFVVKWQGPTLNAGSDAVAEESVEICHRGMVPPGT